MRRVAAFGRFSADFPIACLSDRSHSNPSTCAVYAITSRSSFEELVGFKDQILRVKDADRVPMVVVGNKSDLESERQVSNQEGADLARSFGAPFFETSAKTRVNVEESFYQIVREIRKDGGGPVKAEKKKKGGKCRLF